MAMFDFDELPDVTGQDLWENVPFPDWENLDMIGIVNAQVGNGGFTMT